MIDMNANSYAATQKLKDMMDAISNEYRWMIVRELGESKDRPTVNDLRLRVNDLMGVDIGSQSFSAHVNKLKKAGILEVQKDGMKRFYRVKFDNLLIIKEAWTAILNS